MSIKKNFVYNFLYQILIMLLPIITTPYISRVIGAEGVGIQSYSYSIVNYFVLFAMLGISNHGNRTIAIVRDDKEKLNNVFMSIYKIQLMMSALMLILYIFYIIFIADDYKIIFLIQLLYILSALLDINWFFFGIEQFKLTVIRNTIIKLISVLSIFLFVKDTNDLYIYSLILAVGNLLGQIILWKYIGKYIVFVKVSKNDIIAHIKPIIILFIPVISVSIYKIMDKIMLGAMSNMMQVGFYENSEKIIIIPMGVIVALGTVMLPKMSNLYATGKDEESKKYIGLSIEFVMFMAFGAMFGLISISPLFIPLFLGEEFEACINIVCLLSIAIIFLSWANVLRTQYLIPKKKDKIYIISTIIGAIANLIINLLLINRLGAIGAAVGTILAELIVAFYQTLSIRTELDIKKYFNRSIFYIIPGIIMFIFIRFLGYMLQDSISLIIIQIILGAILYVVISLVYMFFVNKELFSTIIGFLPINKRQLNS